MTNRTDKRKHDWSRVDAMTDAEVEVAASADPDAQPLTDERIARMQQRPRVVSIRRALGMTQVEFSKQFGIPIGTLRDWEQGITTPDASARSYLKVIARNPKAVREALEPA